jgi:cysteine synthase A
MSKTYGPTEITESALSLIGNTPLIALDRLWTGPGRILGKCEFLNPGGSIKDRSSYSMIQQALSAGKLEPHGNIVEVTSGNQGCGLALVSAVLQHPLTAVMSKGNSPQRAEMMRGMGAEVVLVDQVSHLSSL